MSIDPTGSIINLARDGEAGKYAGNAARDELETLAIMRQAQIDALNGNAVTTIAASENDWPPTTAPITPGTYAEELIKNPNAEGPFTAINEGGHVQIEAARLNLGATFNAQAAATNTIASLLDNNNTPTPA